jgi:hypothetical protein
MVRAGSFGGQHRGMHENHAGKLRSQSRGPCGGDLGENPPPLTRGIGRGRERLSGGVMHLCGLRVSGLANQVERVWPVKTKVISKIWKTFSI